jgi:hypothetical protein
MVTLPRPPSLVTVGGTGVAALQAPVHWFGRVLVALPLLLFVPLSAALDVVLSVVLDVALSVVLEVVSEEVLLLPFPPPPPPHAMGMMSTRVPDRTTTIFRNPDCSAERNKNLMMPSTKNENYR